MGTEAKTTPREWVGRVLSGLIVLFMAFDAGMKLALAPPVVEASAKFGLTPNAILAIGAVLLASVVLYSIPRTAVLGAILLTGYLGGAIATHVVRDPEVFPMVFASVLGVLAWLGLALRDPRLFGTIFARR